REGMFERFFHDEDFVKAYVEYLYKFTHPDYLDQLFATIGPEMKQREAWLRKEWPTYRYNLKAIYAQAKKVRLKIMPMKRTSVKSHLQGKNADGNYRYRIFNYHCLPVMIEGVGAKEDQMDVAFSEPRMIDPFASKYPAEYVDGLAPEAGKWLFFRVPGMDSLFSTEVLQWPSPEALTPEQELFADLRLDSAHIYKVDEAEKTVTFETGSYKTDRDILIPPGYVVKFEAGVELDMVKKAKFISKSQVLMFGTEERPIKVTSSDASANGFTILQPDKKSEMRYVIFDNLNTLEYKGWNLTGAVTLYEAEVKIDHSRFVNNHCEDGLNIIRSVFHMVDSYVGHTFADGFDADFCTGTVEHCYFYKTGNDGMDFSGSHITIQDTEVESAGDKGISLGEESTIIVNSATVKTSVIGLAAKDLTAVDVKYVKLEGNQRAFAAYQKKPEYGPAKITVHKYDIVDNDELHWLQNGSVLKLGEKVYKGKK
ncbi:MAG: hypothetical protein AAF570_06865, partial [Bacteroidota bacterium]